jgi:hypothetical protein
MGLYITLQPMVGIGFSFNFAAPFIELCFGPFIVIFGDLSRIEGLENDDD